MEDRCLHHAAGIHSIERLWWALIDPRERFHILTRPTGTYHRLIKEWDKLSYATQGKILNDLQVLIRHRVAISGQLWPKDEIKPHDDQHRFEEEFLAFSVLSSDSDAEDENRPSGPAPRTRQLSTESPASPVRSAVPETPEDPEQAHRRSVQVLI
jgi:hypothetical protein